MVRGCMNSPNDALNYFQDVQVFAPNLNEYEVEFNEELSNEQSTVRPSIYIWVIQELVTGSGMQIKQWYLV